MDNKSPQRVGSNFKTIDERDTITQIVTKETTNRTYEGLVMRTSRAAFFSLGHFLVVVHLA